MKPFGSPSAKPNREQHPLWMLLPTVLFKIALNYKTSMALAHIANMFGVSQTLVVEQAVGTV